MYLNSAEYLIFEQKSEQEGDRLPAILLPLPNPCGRYKGTAFSDLTAKETPRVSAATFAYLGHCGGLLKQEPAVFRVLQENGG